MNGFRVPPEKRYQEQEYSYDSSNSKIAEDHFDAFAQSIGSFAHLGTDDLVVDIGGNVGTLLSSCKKKYGSRVLNVEPAKNIVTIAEKNGVPTLERFWDTEAAQHIKKDGGAAVITATNVFNHIDDIDAFFANLEEALQEDGVFVAEVPYFATLIERDAFDTMYLEHVSYFSVGPLKRYLAEKNFRIMRIEKSEYMGGSITFFIGKGEESHEVNEYIGKEEEMGLYAEQAYTDFRARVQKLKESLLSELREAKAGKGIIVGIGAATKGNTLLNYCGIDSSLVSYITDASPLKIGKYTPGSAIPIRPDTEITEDVTHAVVLAWNIAEYLTQKIAASHPHLRFIVPHMA